VVEGIVHRQGGLLGLGQTVEVVQDLRAAVAQFGRDAIGLPPELLIR
jgi:hypothetical protein